MVGVADTIRELMQKLNNLNIQIRKIHIRYEDDYFEAENPYSFGIIADELTFETVEAPHGGKTDGNEWSLNKELHVKNTRVYWNSMSETFIPTSLWEQTKDLEFRIFEAIAADDLFSLMYEPFETTTSKQYFSNKDELILPFNLKTVLKFYSTDLEVKEKMKLLLEVKLDSLKIDLNDKVISDMKNMFNFYNNYMLAWYIKQYRPRVKPIVNSTAKNSEKQKRKRRLIVRDWLQFIIWANRMK